jgi:hypothetical protein
MMTCVLRKEGELDEINTTRQQESNRYTKNTDPLSLALSHSYPRSQTPTTHAFSPAYNTRREGRRRRRRRRRRLGGMNPAEELLIHT